MSLAGKSVSNVTCLVSSRTLNLNSISHSVVIVVVVITISDIVALATELAIGTGQWHSV